MINLILNIRDLISISDHWNFHALRNSFDNESIKVILRMPLLFPNTKDRWIWAANQSSLFSVKITYLFNQSSHFQSNSRESSSFQRLFWKAKLHEMHKIIWWSILNDILLTKDFLLQSSIIEGSSCPFYNQYAEIINYLFQGCNMAKVLWFSSPQAIQTEAILFISLKSCVKDLLNSNNQLALTIPAQELLLYSFILIDSIWHARDQFIHTSIEANFLLLKNCIHEKWFEFYIALLVQNTCVPSHTWNPPHTNWIKLNFDAIVKFSLCYQCCCKRLRRKSHPSCCKENFLY